MKKSLIKAQSATALAIVLAGAAATAAPSVASVLAERGTVVKAEENGSTGAAAITDAKPAASVEAQPAADAKPAEASKPKTDEAKSFDTNQFEFAEDGKSVDVVTKLTGDKHLKVKSIDLVNEKNEVVSNVYTEGSKDSKVETTEAGTTITSKLMTKAAKNLKLRIAYSDEGLDTNEATVAVGFVTPNGMTGSAAKVFNSKAKEADVAKALVDSLQKDAKPADQAAKPADQSDQAKPTLKDLVPEFKAANVEEAVTAAKKVVIDYEAAHKTLDIPASAKDAEKEATTAIAGLKEAAEKTDATVDSIKEAYNKAAEAVKKFDSFLTDSKSTDTKNDDKADHKAELKKEVETAKAALNDKAELSNVKPEAKAKYDAAKAKLTDLVTKADALLAKSDATDKEAEDLTKELTAANKEFKAILDELKAQPSSVKMDKEGLQKLVTEAEKFRNAQYDQTKLDEVGKTKLANALEALGHAITDAKAALINEKASAKDVEDAYMKLDEQIKEFKKVATDLGVDLSVAEKDEPKQAASVEGEKYSKSNEVPLKPKEGSREPAKEGGKYANTGEASGIAATLTGVFGLLGTATLAFLKRRSF